MRYLLVGLCLFFYALPSQGQTDDWCGRLKRDFGPFDYTDAEQRARLPVVERVHFNEDVRSLRKGATGALASDIEYVLNWYPNHHLALDALARLAIREGTARPQGAEWPIECRFQWARQVNPQDALVPLIAGLYYHRLGRDAEARQYLEQAAKLDSANAEVHYNLGLVLFRMGDYSAARDHARRAYRLGYPLPGLRNMLERTEYPLGD